MDEGGGFLREPGFDALAPFTGSGRKRKGGSYSTRELDDLVARARAPAGAPLLGNSSGTTAQEGAGLMPPAAQAAIQAFDDELDDEAYVAMLSQLPSDTVAALQMLRGQFLHHSGKWEDRCAPVALATQLYAVVNDRTAVDRAVDAEARAGRARRFKLSTGADDFAVMLEADYIQEVNRAHSQAGASTSASTLAASSNTLAAAMEIAESERLLSKHAAQRRAKAPSILDAIEAAEASERSGAEGAGPGAGPAGRGASVSLPLSTSQEQQRQRSSGRGAAGAAGPEGRAAAGPSPFELFRDRVLPHAHGLSISQAELAALLSGTASPQAPGAAFEVSGPAGIAGGAAVPRRAPSAAEEAVLRPDGAVSALLTAGFLSRGLQQDNALLWFTFPRGGQLAKAVLAGRQVLSAALRKQPMKQLRQKDAEKLKVRGSPFPALFHIRDAVGGHLLSSLETTTGPLLRLPEADGSGVGARGRGRGKKR